ncbi:MAG: RNA 2',3'-cyclic phosphodiesterase [Pseudomonadota bacterium]
MDLTRSFVALPLPERIRDGLAAVALEIPSGRIVCAESFHITLAFLGDQDDEALEELNEALAGLRQPHFEIRLKGLGSFGGSRLRALWAEVVAPPELRELQRAIVRAARRAGITLKHRRFVPHVTLARFRNSWVEDAAFARFVERHAGFSLPVFEARAFALYASHLSPAGAVYEELARYPLGFDQAVGSG